ncbi:hypothetical protein [Cellulomonas sp. C5510]|uniref:hypothetical protein n=1 Tax=Cellulomonas sp. C5510 TaxID=2871170 RepID=UPI001C969BB0|nr:hypothetical protein [Cellulomonas sp. C5510]QZN84737.1 hypothetical protein K5O09_12990 [Cellulomonas sp. C5510]
MLHDRHRRRTDAVPGPAETDPAETDPAQPDPAETDPAQTDPAETDPAQPRPADPPGATRAPGGGPWQVVRAGVVDVNRIARMLAEHRPFIDLDGDGRPDEVPRAEHAGPATRMVLSLGALEHGEVWFARDDAGDVLAVAVWLPPDAEHLAHDLHRVVARELGVTPERDPEPAHAPLRSLVGATARTLVHLRDSDAERVLILLADAGRVADARRRVLLADVLAPVLRAQGDEGRETLAVTVDPAQVADLAALGFAERARSPLGAASLWLGAHRPSPVPEPAAVGPAVTTA